MIGLKSNYTKYDKKRIIFVEEIPAICAMNFSISEKDKRDMFNKGKKKLSFQRLVK